MTKKEITTTEAELTPQDTQITLPDAPESLIAQAITKGVSVDVMERLLTMRRELRAEKSKELYDDAMSKFQGECPIIKKTKAGGQTRTGQVAYHYAPLESIVEQTKALIKNHGFSYAIQTQTLEGKVKVTCIVKHEAGHSESSDVEVPLGTQTGVMSASQVVASALTFAKRYAFCNAFGILTGDDDDDANQTKQETKNDTTFKKLMGMLETMTLAQIKDYKKKMESSSKYSEDQKAEFCIAVEEKIKELESSPE